MEQLGKKSGPAARLDTILRHLSPRLGTAPALVSFVAVGRGWPGGDPLGVGAFWMLLHT